MNPPRLTEARLSGLFALTPDDPDTARLAAKVAVVIDGGAALVQYRNKTADPALRHAQAHVLAALCRDRGVPLIINDDIALACEVGAAGAHIGRGDGDIAAARAALGPERLLGVSCYNDLARARTAVAAGANYIAFGAVFASSTKPGAVPATLDLITAARALGRPIAAIGGITLERAPQVLAAGADLLAVISDLFDAPDPQARAAGYRPLFVTSNPNGISS